MSESVTGPDGRLRCPWALSTNGPDGELYRTYHDEEWGQPVRTDAGLYERMVLEAFQSGLSWLTILRKREGFRAAFAGFDPDAVAGFGPADVDRLLADPGIVRNRKKVEAAIHNAGAVLALAAAGRSLTELLWSYADATTRAVPTTITEVPALTPASTAMAKELKRDGFVFVGPTTCYALMQATGLVNDHLADCWVRTA